MMTKPGITELDRCVDSRYTLVSMVSKRARMIGIERTTPDEDGNEPAYNPRLEKPVTQAVEEIANGVVGYVRSRAIEPASEYREQKLEAISQFERGNIDATDDGFDTTKVSADESDTEE